MRNLIQKMQKNKEGTFTVICLIAWILLNIAIAEPLRQARRREKAMQATDYLHAQTYMAGGQLWPAPCGGPQRDQRYEFINGMLWPAKIIILPALLYAEESKFGRRPN
jgi:hypothetical protein